MRIRHIALIILCIVTYFSSNAAQAETGWYRNAFPGSPWTTLPLACEAVCNEFNGTVTICQPDNYHPDGTPSKAQVNCSAGGGGSSYLSHDLCPAGETYDFTQDKCVAPTNCPSGSFTVDYAGPEFVTTTSCVVNGSGFSCEGTASGPPITNNNGLTVQLYSYTGDECGVNNDGTGGPEVTPKPEPVDPITPTPEPEPPVTDDGDTTDEPATDENQEVISNQLKGIQEQIQNLEQGSVDEVQTGNQSNSLLSEILSEIGSLNSNGSGGTTDGDGDGTDDSFGDASCLGPPVCNGPAIECAIAAQAYWTRCNLQDETEDIVEQDVMDTLGATQTIEEYFDPADPDNQVDVTGSFTAPVETTSACPGDYAIGTRFGTFNISYGYMCDFGNTVRPIVLLSAWIIAGLMFYGSLMRDW